MLVAYCAWLFMNEYVGLDEQTLEFWWNPRQKINRVRTSSCGRGRTWDGALWLAELRECKYRNQWGGWSDLAHDRWQNLRTHQQTVTPASCCWAKRHDYQCRSIEALSSKQPGGGEIDPVGVYVEKRLRESEREKENYTKTKAAREKIRSESPDTIMQSWCNTSQHCHTALSVCLFCFKFIL